MSIGTKICEALGDVGIIKKGSYLKFSDSYKRVRMNIDENMSIKGKPLIVFAHNDKIIHIPIFN